MTTVVDPEGLARAVARGRSVVLFHATWCPHCRRFAPEFRRALEAADGRRAVEAVVDDEANPLWTLHAIEVVPTVIFFEDGRATKRLDGVLGVGLDAERLGSALAE